MESAMGMFSKQKLNFNISYMQSKEKLTTIHTINIIWHIKLYFTFFLDHLEVVHFFGHVLFYFSFRPQLLFKLLYFTIII